jgi:uridine kinase
MIIIGITGASGSGKSYFLKQLLSQLPENEVIHLALDNYYFPRELQQKDENGIENFDIPTAFNESKLLSDIEDLKLGKAITFETYNYNNSLINKEFKTIEPRKIVIIEGIFVFNFESILPHFSYKIYIDAPTELNINRRLKRDAIERGYDYNDVVYRYHNHVIPAFETHILPTKNIVDIIVDNSKSETLNNDLEVITSWILNNLL